MIICEGTERVFFPGRCFLSGKVVYTSLMVWEKLLACSPGKVVYFPDGLGR